MKLHALRCLLFLSLAGSVRAGATLAVAPGAVPLGLAPQEFAAADEFPRGIVLDSELRPIEGARVWLAIDSGISNPWARAVAQRLSRVPLPETRSQADGGFVLPVLPQQRPLGTATVEFGSPRGPMLWLIVECEGYLPWREPLHHGLAGFVGSRVILRPVVDGDPFAEIPWPPALAEMEYPWVVLGTRHPAERATRTGPVPAPAPAVATQAVALRIVDARGQGVARAELMFEEKAYSAGHTPPPRTGEDGRVTLALPPGEHLVRVFAKGLACRAVRFDVPAGSASEIQVDVPTGEWVDIVAVDRDGRGVPFVKVPIVSLSEGPENGMPPFSARSDSEGRIRCNVVRRDAYIAYSDERAQFAASHRVALDSEEPGERRADGAVLVPCFRPVTLVVEADRLRAAGELRRVTDNGSESFLGFGDAGRGERVVTRVLTREHAEVWVRQRGIPPLVLRSADLPPRGAEPMLDLAVLDRRLKLRARLDVQSTAGGAVRTFVAEPMWQDEVFRDESEDCRFNRGRGAGIELWARDTAAYVLRIGAMGHHKDVLSLPAAAAGAAGEIPNIAVRLEPIE